jgi:hypothetical protein
MLVRVFVVAQSVKGKSHPVACPAQGGMDSGYVKFAPIRQLSVSKVRFRSGEAS